MDEIISQLESKRKAVVKSYYLSGGMLAVTVISFLFAGLRMPFIPILFAIATVIVFVVFSQTKKRTYVKSFKHELVETILKNTFTDLQFNPSTGIEKSVIADTDMMTMGNRYHSEDYVRGKYKDTNFEQADVCIEQVTSDGKNTHTTTYFRGRWMIFDFNKNFASDLLVREEGFAYAKTRSGWFTSKSERLQKLELEDSEFNNCFDVFAQNEQEAYYILTPQIMQSMMILKNRTKGRIILCFCNSKLHVGLNDDKDSFEPPVFSPINMIAINQINEEINIITRFVDELKLNITIYKQN